MLAKNLGDETLKSTLKQPDISDSAIDTLNSDASPPTEGASHRSLSQQSKYRHSLTTTLSFQLSIIIASCKSIEKMSSRQTKRKALASADANALPVPAKKTKTAQASTSAAATAKKYKYSDPCTVCGFPP
jgi:hypothetical protein